MRFKQIIITAAQKKQKAIGWFMVLVIIQSLFSIYGIIRIPVDPKNITVLGLTRGRIALIIVILGIDILGSVAGYFYDDLKGYIKLHGGSKKFQQILQSSVIFFMIIFWITLWLPAHRLGEYFEEFERLRPFLLWLGAVSCEFFILLRIFSLARSRIVQDKKAISITKPFFISLLIALCIAGLYLSLRKNIIFSSGIIEPAPTLITPLQLFLLWVLVIIVYYTGAKRSLFSKPAAILITITTIYILSCVFALTTPIECEGDLVGIYPPNFTCYPDIDDSVFHVGSLYTYYGEGIFNQWFTDKPLYMLFLSLCQWIAGIHIQQYMTAQVIFLSFLPVAIFCFVRKMADSPSALLASLLFITAQYNSIHLYSKLGGVNIRIAASELLTVLFLIFSALAIFNWFRQPKRLSWSLITGLLIGLTILSRFNAIMIIPMVVLAVVIFYFKNKQIGLRALGFFSAGLAITLLPWFLLAPIVNHNTVNPYLEKIRNVFIDRTRDSTDLVEIEEASPVIVVEDIQQTQEQPVLVPSVELTESHAFGFPERVSLHFANNLLSAFFSMPINSSYLDPIIITKQPFWNWDSQPIWQRDMSFENLSLWCASIFLFIWGVWQSWRRWKISGLSPLIVFLGYLLGDAVALTSGSRYLAPVLWIVYLYCSFAIIQITGIVMLKLGFSFNSKVEEKKGSDALRDPLNIEALQDKKGIQSVLAALLILPAIILPFLHIIPDRLPSERNSQTEQLAYTYLQSDLDPAVWETFLAEDNSIITEGLLFFPQYYGQSDYPLALGKNVLETLVLGRDHVYMNYLFNLAPKTITDGSEVIIVGCKIEEGILWGMDHRVVQAIAVIQLDNEKKVYIDPQAAWTCR